MRYTSKTEAAIHQALSTEAFRYDQKLLSIVKINGLYSIYFLMQRLFTGCDMRTVYVAVITLFFIAFIIDTDAFYFIPVIISAGNTVYPETISFS